MLLSYTPVTCDHVYSYTWSERKRLHMMKWPRTESFSNLIWAQTYWPRSFEASLKQQFTATCLTEEWEKDRVVVRHDKQVDAGESGAGFKVAKRLPQVILLGTAANKHLRTTKGNYNVKHHFGYWASKLNFRKPFLIHEQWQSFTTTIHHFKQQIKVKRDFE